MFVPGLTDFESISRLSQAIQLPLNVLAGPWISDLTPLKSFGVARVTMGSSGIRECAGHLQTHAHHYLDGNYTLRPNISYEELRELF